MSGVEFAPLEQKAPSSNEKASFVAGTPLVRSRAFNHRDTRAAKADFAEEGIVKYLFSYEFLGVSIKAIAMTSKLGIWLYKGLVRNSEFHTWNITLSTFSKH